MNKNIILIIIVLSFSLLAQLSLNNNVDWWQYSRGEIESGQWWRMITGNFIHLSWRHFVLNSVALVAIYALFPNTMNLTGWFLAFIVGCLSVTLGIWFFSPEVYWYVGLSGSLHAILMVLVILDYAKERNKLCIFIFLVLVAKLVWETVLGPMPGSEITAGGSVIVKAHLYGAFGGILFAACMLLYIYSKNKKL